MVEKIKPIENKQPEKKNEDVIKINVKKLPMHNWAIATYIFGVLSIILLIMLFTGNTFGLMGKVISEADMKKQVDTFVNTQLIPQGGANIEDLKQESGLYVATVSLDGSKVPLYFTKDGKFISPGRDLTLINSNIPVDNSNTNTPGKIVQASVDNDAVEGSSSAKVTIIEFSDYQCPFCRKFWSETYHQLKKEYIDTGKVKLVLRDFPLEFHPSAMIAAQAAECVREKGGDSAYFKMHDKMFSEQNKLDGGDSLTGPVKTTVQFTKEDLKKWAKDLGYDIASCLDTEKFKSEVEKDLADGQAAGVSGTPSFIINGKELSGAQPFSAFKSTIDAELNK